jgi:hypothetical protein
MNRLPRPIADWFALWRDLPRYPRQTLLNRSHLRASTTVIAVAMLVNLVVESTYTTATVYVVLALLGSSSIVSLSGAVAHTLWDRGVVWTDLSCEFCSDGDDDGDGDGDDDEPEPPDSDGDDDGLIREITDYLHVATYAASH